MSEKLLLAREMCKKWHDGQLRKYTHDPYHVHPFEVSEILSSVDANEKVQIAGLLHDVIEDCGVTREDIADLFGQRVADLVVMVTDISKPEDGNRAIRKALDKDHLAKADSDGQTVKLADLISNLPSIVEHDPGFAKVYMAEKKDLLQVLKRGNQILHERANLILADYVSRT